MALDYDTVLGHALGGVRRRLPRVARPQITLNGTAQPGIAQYERPAGMPDINNEGFATAPASLSVDGQRPVWWFADGYASEALRTGIEGGDEPGRAPGGEDGQVFPGHAVGAGEEPAVQRGHQVL